MICYKNNPSNSNYIMFSVTDRLKISSSNSFIKNEIDKLNNAVSSYEKDRFIFDSISVRKDSILGNYILKNPNMFQEYISYNDVVGAFNVSIFTGNEKMSNKLMGLFLGQKYGTRSELEKYCSDNELDYIGKNRSFSTFLKNRVGEDSVYAIYDNGVLFLEKNLNSKGENGVKVMKK